MTLSDLQEELLSSFPLSVQKDIKTAVRVLARALNYTEPKCCPLKSCLRPLPDLYRVVVTYLVAQRKGAATIRVTKNCLSRLFRLAEVKGLFSLLPPRPTPQFQGNSKPRRLKDGPYWWDGTTLGRRDWPPPLEAEFLAFTKWATEPLVENRDAKFTKRQSTIADYQRSFESYFGYLHHILLIHPVKFDHLFNFTFIKQYIFWHVNEKHKRPTRNAHEFLKCLLAMTRQYSHNLTLREQLKTFQKSIPKPLPFYNKNDAWASLHELKQIGVALWPKKPPQSFSGNGKLTAAKAGLSLLFQLWVHIPYRSRNIREMKLGTNLYQTSEGHWRIRFAGEELKIAVKQGECNVFDVPFPPSLLGTLEGYLHIWRPILAGRYQRSEVFLTSRGTPYTVLSLGRVTKKQVYIFTGKPHWHPHIIRTIWATEWIKSHGDFYTAAIMLNDRLETVIKSYAHLLHEDVAEKAYQWVQEHVH